MVEIRKKVLGQFGWESIIITSEEVDKDDIVMTIQQKDGECVVFGGCQIDELIDTLAEIKKEIKDNK
ncbi:hypothetical protein LCGC14_1625060 [marine sediment metagenome]|uniref:Uncharacterized protein n=1 Tax=marine sediment metagenome TaxID=412755 RepID=A0A0F9I4C8_9ZZZZ